MSFPVNKLLLLIALVLFVLAAFNVKIDDIQIGWLGLAFMAAAGLV